MGKAPEIKKVNDIYTFPIGKDGILKVSNKDADYDASIGKFFYVDEKGNTIRELDQEKEVPFGNIVSKDGANEIRFATSRIFLKDQLEPTLIDVKVD